MLQQRLSDAETARIAQINMLQSKDHKINELEKIIEKLRIEKARISISSPDGSVSLLRSSLTPNKTGTNFSKNVPQASITNPTTNDFSSPIDLNHPSPFNG